MNTNCINETKIQLNKATSIRKIIMWQFKTLLFLF